MEESKDSDLTQETLMEDKAASVLNAFHALLTFYTDITFTFIHKMVGILNLLYIGTQLF